MPKPGMTSICLKQEVADLLRKRAHAANQGLNDYLTSLLIGPSLAQSGPSQQCIEDRPGAVPSQQIIQGSLVGYLLDVQRVVGSSPAQPTTEACISQPFATMFMSKLKLVIPAALAETDNISFT